MKHFKKYIENLRESIDHVMEEGNLMYEQDLPKDISEQDYAIWFEQSSLMYGVRVGPKFEKYGRENNS